MGGSLANTVIVVVRLFQNYYSGRLRDRQDHQCQTEFKSTKDRPYKIHACRNLIQNSV